MNGTPVGYTDLSQATIGAQLGGQTYTQFRGFRIRRGLSIVSARATMNSALRLLRLLCTPGGERTPSSKRVLPYSPWMKKALMFEAAVGGQKFSYEAFASR